MKKNIFLITVFVFLFCSYGVGQTVVRTATITNTTTWANIVWDLPNGAPTIVPMVGINSPNDEIIITFNNSGSIALNGIPRIENLKSLKLETSTTQAGIATITFASAITSVGSLIFQPNSSNSGGITTNFNQPVNITGAFEIIPNNTGTTTLNINGNGNIFANSFSFQPTNTNTGNNTANFNFTGTTAGTGNLNIATTLDIQSGSTTGTTSNIRFNRNVTANSFNLQSAINRRGNTNVIFGSSNITTNTITSNFSITNNSTAGTNNGLLVRGNANIIIGGNLLVDAGVGNSTNTATFGVAQSTTVNGDVVLGNTTSNTVRGTSTIGKDPGISSVIMQQYNLNGNLTLHERSTIAEQYTVFRFIRENGIPQVITNNSPDALFTPGTALNFETLIIGNQNSTVGSKVIFQGINPNAYLRFLGAPTINSSLPPNSQNDQRGATGISINSNSVLDIPIGYAINGLAIAPNLSSHQLFVAANGRLRIGGITGGQAGSNFPIVNRHFLNAQSIVEYYGNATTNIASPATQTIFATPVYGRLETKARVANILQTIPGTGLGRSQKIITNPVTVQTSFNVFIKTDVTLGTANNQNDCAVICNGLLNLAPSNDLFTPYLSNNGGAGLYCNANTVSGAGNLVMGDYAYLGLGAAAGINGNILLPSPFNITGNYRYNGTVNQVTGTNLPATINDLIVDNSNIVTNSQNLTVDGICNLEKGVFDIVTTTLTSNARGKIQSNTGKIKANAVCYNLPPNNELPASSAQIVMKGNELNQTLSSNWFVDNTIATLINHNTAATNSGITVSAAPDLPLLISTFLGYGKDANNNYINASTINTNDNLTLLSREEATGSAAGTVPESAITTGTANFGDATGNFIVGKVSIERFVPRRRDGVINGSWVFLATPVQTALTDPNGPTIAESWREGPSPFNLNGYGTVITTPGQTSYGISSEFDYSSFYPSMKVFNPNLIGIANPAIGAYDGISGTSSKIANLKGYMVFIRGDRTVGPPVSPTNPPKSTIMRMKGLVRTGAQTFEFPIASPHSIGNPFPSRIDFRLKTSIAVEDAYSLWNPIGTPSTNGIGAFETYVNDGGVYAIPGTTPPLLKVRNYIESGQAIFVSSNVAPPPPVPPMASLTFYESSKAVGSDIVSKPAGRHPSISVGMFVENGTTSTDPNHGFVSGVVAHFNNNYSIGFDNDDVIGMANPNNSLSIKRASKLLIAERRPHFLGNDSIPLNIVNLSQGGSFRFDVTPYALSALSTSFTISLLDRYLNSSEPLSFGNLAHYKFNTTADPASYAANRFVIIVANNGGVFSEGRSALTNNNQQVNPINGSQLSKTKTASQEENLSVTNTLAVQPNPIENATLRFQLGNKANGRYTVQIVNQLGQIIKTESIQVQSKNTWFTIDLANNSKGNYMAIVIDNQGKKDNISFMIK
jgi:hypothetical protein